MRFLLSIVLSIALFGCESIPESPSQVFPVYVSLIPNVSDVIRDRLTERESIYLELGLIPGGLYGSPLGEPNFYIDMSADASPSLDIANFELEIAGYAQKPNGHSTNSELTYEPSNVELLRVSTMGVDAQEEVYLGGSLLDKDENYLLLVYFDRACEIIGEIDFGDEGVYKHNIVVPSSGIYRLVVKGDGEYMNVTAIKELSPLYVQLK